MRTLLDFRWYGRERDRCRPLRWLRVGLEPRDCWVGLFWRRDVLWVDFYFCLVPCVVVWLRLGRRSR